MSLNIIDLIKGQLGPALISQAAIQLGESESGVSKAINGFLPVILGGLADNSENFLVLDAVKGAVSSGLLGNLLGGSSDNPIISAVLSSILGDKLSGLVGSISNFAGISESSSNSLLNVVTGATLGAIGKYATDSNLDASGISSLLNSQKNVISDLLPAGLSLEILGLRNWFDGANGVVKNNAISDAVVNLQANAGQETEKVKPETSKIDITTTGNTNVSKDSKEEGSLLKWLLPLLLLLLAGYFVWKQWNKPVIEEGEEGIEAVESDSTEIADSTTVAKTLERVEKELILPSGTKIKAYAGGIEEQLIAFLQSDEYKNATAEDLKNRWFDFDNLNFEFGTAMITQESLNQLENLKTILKEFPEAKIKIGAYTDRVEDEQNNLKLSQERADAVKSALTLPQVIDAEGYGEQFATVDENASDKEREADRKTAIRFEK